MERQMPTGAARLPTGAARIPRAANPRVRAVPLVDRNMTPPNLYEAALLYARSGEYRASRVLFERLLRQQPDSCKAWVSFAMMEKRCASSSASERFAKCRAVLQRGLQLNPDAACLVQAWGLMELQKGNWWAALLLLERSVRIDPRLKPVLNWSQVDTARKTVGSRRPRSAGHAGTISEPLVETDGEMSSSVMGGSC